MGYPTPIDSTELPNHFQVFPYVDANYAESPRLILILEFVQQWHLATAGWTPGCPEIEHNGLSTQIRKLHPVAAQIDQRKVRHRVS